MSDEPEYEIGMFNPVRSIEQVMFDYSNVVEHFEHDTSGLMTPEEFLAATQGAKERLEAIITMTLNALVQRVNDKIPDHVRSTFEQQLEVDALMTSPEERQRRMLQLIREIASWTTRRN